MWIGATCSGQTPNLTFSNSLSSQFLIPGHHNTNHYGNWTWDEAGKELEWFDWLQDEPNDYETQK